jgi:hypothetical protein
MQSLPLPCYPVSFGPNIFFSTLLSKTLILLSTLIVTGQVSHPRRDRQNSVKCWKHQKYLRMYLLGLCRILSKIWFRITDINLVSGLISQNKPNFHGNECMQSQHLYLCRRKGWNGRNLKLRSQFFVSFFRTQMNA